MDRKEEVLEKLRGITDPDLEKDIITLGSVKDLSITNTGSVSFTVLIATPGESTRDRIHAECEKALKSLPWVTAVHALVGAAPPRRERPKPLARKQPGLEKVHTILAVSSCKGGVGKSTAAVNLAFTLARMGARVGIFDADVYGPSLPTMVAPPETGLYAKEEMIQPLEFEGVKLMSFGFVNTGPDGGGPAIMRGPMVTSVINQLLTTTEWGELDYLVIDFPPGTGDIQLTLTQLIPITAAIIVTTPQQLSFVDVVKGIKMFDKLKVPTIGVIENMSYFQCGKCGEKEYLFGQGARNKLVEQFGIQNSFEVPVVPAISRYGDSGVPIVLADPHSPVAEIFRNVAESVVEELTKIMTNAIKRPTLNIVPERGIVVTLADGREAIVNPAELRRRCRCAYCIEEFTGRALLDPKSVSDSIRPISIAPLGNYAVAVSWSDGHSSSIYPYDVILDCAGIGSTASKQ